MTFLKELKENDAYMLEAFLEIKCPTLMIHGEKDGAVPVDQAGYIHE